jgi:hypothetical protein
MDTQHTTSPASIDADKRASTQAQIEHARAIIDAQHDEETDDRGVPTDAAWEREEAAMRSALPIVDANRIAREIVYLLEENRPVDAAAKLAGLPASQAISVALALDCARHQRAALRLAYDANERETLESEEEHADALYQIANDTADRLAQDDCDEARLLEDIGDQLASIGYTTTPPSDFHAEPPLE